MDQLDHTLPTITSLSAHLSRLRLRLRLRDGWLLAQRSLWLSAAAMVLVQLAGRAWPIPQLAWWTLAPLPLWLLVVLSLSILHPLPPLRVARRIDAELGLKERLATAWSLSGTDGRSSPRTISPPLAALQHRDALAVARQIEPRRALPLRWLRRPLLVAAAILATAVALAILPNRMEAILAERAAIAEAAEEQAARIEALRNEIETMAELTPEERQVLLRQLDELAKQLRENSGRREDALADLSRVEEQLRQRLDPNADARQAALEALTAQLQALLKSEGAEETQDPAGTEEQIDEMLQELAEKLAGMSADERQAVAQSLAQMAARAAQAGDANLAQALAALAQAAQAGDADRAQATEDAAQAAARAIAQAQADLDTQAALQRALAQLQQSRQAMAQTGTGQQGQGTAQMPGLSQGQGQGQGQGQNGQGQGGQGTKANQLPPGTGTGQANRPRGESDPSGISDLNQQIYVPWERRSTDDGGEMSIPGQDTGQGETETRERRDPLPGTPGQALVPYHEVYYAYLDAANQAMEQSSIPSGLRDYVRTYFSTLEPQE